MEASRAQRALLAIVAIALLLAGGCVTGGCKHGSWGDKYGWRCHDDNDERGPQRDRRPG